MDLKNIYILIILLVIYLLTNNISNKDFIKILSGIFSFFYRDKFISNKFINELVLLYTFLLTFFGWEWWWSIAPQNALQCFDNPAMDYYDRAIQCDLPESQITQPQIYHGIANSLGDVFIMMTIYYIGLSASPFAFRLPLKFKNVFKFLFVVCCCGLSQNLLLDSMLNSFPKYCCGTNKKEICPLSWAPLAPCQYCPENESQIISICWRTEISWIITPILNYFLIIYTLYIWQ